MGLIAPEPASMYMTFSPNISPARAVHMAISSLSCGGINTVEKAAAAAKAGADIVVVGNVLEKNIDKLQEFADAVHNA